jgi:tyrosyl-tRNA synthetase
LRSDTCTSIGRRMGGAQDAACKESTDEAVALTRGAVDSLPEGGLADKLALARREGRRLRVKLGIDPTAPDIHLGHAVVLGKLREFQDAGHRVVLIVGDWTARVGDPSGRSELRPMLSAQEIEANAKTFQDQASKILDTDPARLEVRRNSEWLDMGMEELLALVRTTTVAQMLEREDFAKRYGAREPISILELLYPLLQGYDSVAIEADVELGGTDQKFNLLLGRDIQRHYGRPEQAILTMPILVGVEGQRKMSKSLGNQIGITDEPAEMYGKTMSIPDEAMGEYYELLLKRPLVRESAHTGDAGDGSGAISPRDAKRALARELVAWLHSPEDAARAQEAFDRLFVQRETPADIANARARVKDDGKVHVPEVMGEAFGMSRSEARRMIDQGGVVLGEDLVRPKEYDVEVERADGAVLKAGKRRFARLRVQ